MNTVAILETHQTPDTVETVVYLGAAGVYLAVGHDRPSWDPEHEYDIRHSRADGNPVQ